MRAGTFNINDYLDKLYEASDEDDKEKEDKEAKESKEKEDKEEHEAAESEEKEDKEEKETDKDEKKPSSSKAAPSQSTPNTKQSAPDSPKGMTGSDLSDQDGIIMPEDNVKFYNWLKSEYQKGKTEVKVEMKLGDSKFEPGYEMQGQPDTVNDFKPGMFGAIKTADTAGSKAVGGNLNTSNQVTGLSKPAEEQGQGEQLQKSKAMTVRSEPTKPVEGGHPAKATVGEKPATPVAAAPSAAKPEPDEKEAEIEKIDIKTKKDKNA